MRSPKTSAEALNPLTTAEILTLFEPLAGKNLLLAVSGGPDSMALMGMAALWRDAAPDAGAIHVATVDHGLREGSRREAEFVGEQARRLGFDHKILTWEGPKPGARVQEAARDARYGLLTVHAQAIGATHLLTAHTLDDQAETILFRLMRGSGPAGLAGMRPQMQRAGIVHVRPLLDVPKLRLIATCHARNWPFVEDPSNQNVKFARVRLRRLLPLLTEEGLSVPLLALFGARMGKVEAAIAAQVDALWPQVLIEQRADALVFNAERLVQVPQLIVERVVQKALERVEGEGWQRLERVERCCEGLVLAVRTGAAYRRSLGKCLVTLEAGGRLNIRSAPPRRRGQQRI